MQMPRQLRQRLVFELIEARRNDHIRTIGQPKRRVLDPARRAEGRIWTCRWALAMGRFTTARAYRVDARSVEHGNGSQAGVLGYAEDYRYGACGSRSVASRAPSMCAQTG
jgi:hypothetical protein